MHKIGLFQRYYGEGNTNHRFSRRSSLHILKTVPKSIRLLLIAIVFLCAFAGFSRGRNIYLDQATKARPTNFNGIRAIDRSLWTPTHPIRYNNGTHIDDNYTYIRHLGGGQEGSISLYDNSDGVSVAIKTFDLKARNVIPVELAGEFAEYTTTWPSEIEAGLLLSHFDNASYVPVLDYFILQDPSGWSWAMVSPLESGGTLLSLVERERTTYYPRATDLLDSIYRPSFENLLLALEKLHQAGLCHDDIKPDNIFIGDNHSHWIIGDLGNVREIEHPWHKTASWIRQNQLPDCKANDVKRALKTYLSFLRAAAVDIDAFDKHFWQKSNPWSRMYWDLSACPPSARQTARASKTLFSQDYDGRVELVGRIWSYSKLWRATERELTCTSPHLWFAGGPRRMTTSKAGYCDEAGRDP